MAEKIDDGGPAFPVGPGGDTWTSPDGLTSHQFPGAPGMTLRDYFAAQALAALISKRVEDGDGDCLSETQGVVYRTCVDAYTFADEMIRVRSSTPATPPEQP